jgi:signal peptidase I
MEDSLTGQRSSSRPAVPAAGQPAPTRPSEAGPPARSPASDPTPEQQPLKAVPGAPPAALEGESAPEPASSVPAALEGESAPEAARDLPTVPGLALSQALGRSSRTAAAGRQLTVRPAAAASPASSGASVRVQTPTGRRLLWDLLQAAALALVVLISIRSLAQSFRVQGASMEPTYYDGQALLINRLPYLHLDGTPFERWLPVSYQGSVAFLFGGPQRGDVAVFYAVNERNREYLKRIVGLPGDSVLIDQGVLQVNGLPVDEPYIADQQASYTFPPDRRPTVVPDGSYFVLGDNRAESYDSHEGWFVPVENLVGPVWLTYWPPANWRVGQGGERPDAGAPTRFD